MSALMTASALPSPYRWKTADLNLQFQLLQISMLNMGLSSHLSATANPPPDHGSVNGALYLCIFQLFLFLFQVNLCILSVCHRIYPPALPFSTVYPSMASGIVQRVGVVLASISIWECRRWQQLAVAALWSRLAFWNWTAFLVSGLLRRLCCCSKSYAFWHPLPFPGPCCPKTASTWSLPGRLLYAVHGHNLGMDIGYRQRCRYRTGLVLRTAFSCMACFAGHHIHHDSRAFAASPSFEPARRAMTTTPAAVSAGLLRLQP